MKYFRFSWLLILLFSGQVFAVVNTCVDIDGRKTLTDFPCEQLGLKLVHSAGVSSTLSPVPQQVVSAPVNAHVNEVERKPPPLWVPKPVPVVRTTVDRVNFFNIWSVPVYFGSGLDYFLYVAVFSSGLFAIGYLILFIYSRFRRRTSGNA